jgi:tetratricopeptide (TPR) repeat protein
VEQLAETGIIGLGLLLAALLVPLVLAVRRRSDALVAPAGAAYLAFLVHQGVDWDWELPAITFAGLLVGAAIVVTARRERPVRLRSAVRWPVTALFVGVAVFAFVGLVGNRHVAESGDAAAVGNYRLAATRARAAVDWAPWSSDAWRLLGEAQANLGQRAAALASFRTAVAKDPSNTGPWADILGHSSGRTAAQARQVLHRLDPIEFPKG